MALPTNIPSGGDGLDRFSNPQPEEDFVSALPALEDEPEELTQDEIDYREFQEWKQKNRVKSEAKEQAQRNSEKKARGSTSTPNRARPSKNSNTKDIEKPTDQNLDGWEVDPKTGKRYKTLAPTSKEAIAAYKKTKGAGLTLQQAMAIIDVEEGFEVDNLNGLAETFLPHLRVPPSKEEQEELIRKRKEMAERQKRDRAALYAEIEEKLGPVPEPKANPFEEEKPKKRGLFGRKK